MGLMTDQPVPSGAARGAVDLAGLHGSERPDARAGTGSGSGARVGGRDQLHLVATDANFAEIVNRSVRIPMVLVVVSTRLPQSVVFLDTVLAVADGLDGRLQVASADVDANPRILQALQVRSVPMTVGLIQGQALPLFQGAMPEEQLRTILDDFLALAVKEGVAGRLDLGEAVAEEAAELPPLHQEAFDAIEAGDLDAAAAAYEKALAANPKDVDAELGLAQVALMSRTSGVDAAAARAAAAAAPEEVAAQIVVADLDVLGGHVEDAFARLIELVRRTAGADRDAARTHLLSLFRVVGTGDERVRKARTALMSALF